jgi:hypothetical protein
MSCTYVHATHSTTQALTAHMQLHLTRYCYWCYYYHLLARLLLVSQKPVKQHARCHCACSEQPERALIAARAHAWRGVIDGACSVRATLRDKNVGRLENSVYKSKYKTSQRCPHIHCYCRYCHCRYYHCCRCCCCCFYYGAAASGCAAAPALSYECCYQPPAATATTRTISIAVLLLLPPICTTSRRHCRCHWCRPSGQHHHQQQHQLRLLQPPQQLQQQQ